MLVALIVSSDSNDTVVIVIKIREAYTSMLPAQGLPENT